MSTPPHKSTTPLLIMSTLPHVLLIAQAKVTTPSTLIVNRVFDPHFTDALSYSIFALMHSFSYLGFAHGRRTYSRSQWIPGYAQRITEHFLGIRFRGLEAHAYRYLVWRLYPIENLCTLPNAIGSVQSMYQFEQSSIRQITPSVGAEERARSIWIVVADVGKNITKQLEYQITTDRLVIF